MTALTVGLFGGLGNQLFQYAAGRSLSLRLGVPLILDHYGFKFDTRYKRAFELGHFSVPDDFPMVQRPWLFKTTRVIRKLSSFQPALARLAWPHLIVEPSPTFQAGLLPEYLSNNAYMAGYWQDERYFLDAKEIIRQEFSLRGNLTPNNQTIRHTIENCTAVAVHVRQFDPPTPSDSGKNFTTGSAMKGNNLPFTYYRQALHKISTMARKPEFFVFSDNPQWAKENLTFEGPAHFLTHGRGPDREDLILISHCQHHILANSSFSWWGAWLGQRAGQMVIAPKAAKMMPNIPERWARI